MNRLWITAKAGKERRKMARLYTCRSCGAPIIFIVSLHGRSIPCDAQQVVYWQKAGGSKKIVTPNGEVVSCELEGDPQEATGIGYVSHFATCPNADRHRRR